MSFGSDAVINKPIDKEQTKYEVLSTNNKFGMGSNAGGVLTEDEFYSDNNIFCCIIIFCSGAVNKKEAY